jgi:hypothetical protein
MGKFCVPARISSEDDAWFPLGIYSDLIYSGFMDMVMTTATVLSRTQPATAGRAGFAMARTPLLSLRLLLP